MCYETTARPPLPPIAGGSATGEPHTLRSADGTEFRAFTVSPEQPTGAGMVVLPDVRGLHPFYEDLALRFAEVGIASTAIDYFGRTAGVEPRGEEFEFWPHVMETRPRSVAEDVAAGVAHVRRTGATAVFTVGFCFGGRHSFNQAARGHGLSGVIGFYGGVAPQDADDKGSPTQLAPRYECPVLGLFAGTDQRITASDVGAFEAALDAAGVRNEIVTYQGAPHSFFDRAFAEHREACDDAWRRILAFVGANTA